MRASAATPTRCSLLRAHPRVRRIRLEVHASAEVVVLRLLRGEKIFAANAAVVLLRLVVELPLLATRVAATRIATPIGRAVSPLVHQTPSTAFGFGRTFYTRALEHHPLC